MVKLQKRLARKRYLNSKRVYEYERISLHIPKEFHEAIKPYLEEDLCKGETSALKEVRTVLLRLDIKKMENVDFLVAVSILASRRLALLGRCRRCLL